MKQRLLFDYLCQPATAVEPRAQSWPRRPVLGGVGPLFSRDADQIACAVSQHRSPNQVSLNFIAANREIGAYGRSVHPMYTAGHIPSEQWIVSRVVVSLAVGHRDCRSVRAGQLANAGRLTAGSSPIGAMVSSDM